MPNDIQAIMENDWVVFALPAFFAALVIEWLWARRQLQPYYEKDDFQTSMGIMVLTVLVDLVPKIAGISLMFVCYAASPLHGIVGQSAGWWVLLFFLDDITYYFFHRANHEVRFMWAGHASHHNSEFYNLGTALRQGVGERVIKYLFWCPLALLGFHPFMIVTMLSLSLIYQYWIHTQAIHRLPAWYEFVFNTPSHHRVHHGSNVRYLDRNHGATLILWDRLFGTFAQETDSDPVRYGLTKNIETHNVFRAAFGEYQNLWYDMANAPSLGDKFRYFFWAPGWSHDGKDKRSNTLRAETLQSR